MSAGSIFNERVLAEALDERTPLLERAKFLAIFTSNLSTSLIFHLRDTAHNESMYARVKVPENLKQWVPLESDSAPNQKVFVPLHEIIRGNLDKPYSAGR